MAERRRSLEDLGLKMDRFKFFKGKKVLLTGHTGFKGAWLSTILLEAGAEVTGYALEPPTDPSLFSLLKLNNDMRSITGDVRDGGHLLAVVQETKPEILLHLAAQPIVRESYRDPVGTYETNVMGTVNVLEAVRKTDSVCSLLNVTTDKVYKNYEWAWGYRETDELDGYDPYSNSKSCSELVTHSYRSSFLKEQGVAVSTARAGNVIGGGDFAPDRIIPDCVRAAAKGEKITVRNPHSTRPYQHVLEPLGAYLLIAQAQYENPSLADAYNVGPDDCDCIHTGALADCFCRAWNAGLERGIYAAARMRAEWENLSVGGPHEANFLKLDCSKIRSVLGWKSGWHVSEAVAHTTEWYQAWLGGADMRAFTEAQISAYIIKCGVHQHMDVFYD